MKNQAFRPKSPLKCVQNRQSGNVLILILIAVAVFGSFSFVMMRGGRVSQGMMNGEQAKLAAAEIMQYGTQIRDATKALRVNGIPLDQISFEMSQSMLQNGTPAITPNTNCTTNKCRLFHPEGGNVKERHFFDYGIADTWWGPTWSHVGGVEFFMLNVKDVGTIAPEIAFKINQIEKNICRAFNKLAGLPEDSRIWYTATNFYEALPANFGVTDAIDAGYNADTQYKGKMAFCDTEDRIIYMVIVPR